MILDKAEGNPFFLEELTRAVSEQGLGADLPVPDTVHGVLTARIDRLDEDAKRILQTASVLGREFAPSLLAAIWDGPSPVEPHLRQLARLEFLFERTGGDDAVYVFKHALTQDVAEATLLPSRRRELHRRAGEALERLHPDRLAELAPRLAHHYVEAEAWVPAAEHARRAAEAARGVFANREALARYDQAISAAQRAGLPVVARLLSARGPRGRPRRPRGLRARPRRLRGGPGAGQRGDRARSTKRGSSVPWPPCGAATRTTTAACFSVASRLPPPSERTTLRTRRRVSAEAHLRVGLMELNLARMTASRRELSAALALFRDAGDVGGEGRALDALAMALQLSGDLDASIEHMREALPLLVESGDRQTEASCLSNLGFVLLSRGRRAEGEPWIERALAAAQAIGARAQEAYVHSIIAQVLEPFGDWGLALQEASAGLAIARALGHREWTANTLGTLGRLHRSCGDVAGARRLHDEMLAIARDLRTTLWIAEAVGEVGQDLIAAGEADGARLLGEAVELAGEAVQFASEPLLALADLALDQGRPGDALEAARRLQQILPQYVLYATDARRAEGEALSALGQIAEGEALLRRAKAEAADLGAAPPGWRASLALARLLDATGRADEARLARADARRLLEKVAAGLTGVPDLLRGFQASPAYREAAGR